MNVRLRQDAGFILVNRWDNRRQSYADVGTLAYQRLDGGRLAVAFRYDPDYEAGGGADLDPANLAVGSHTGLYPAPGNRGEVPPYFTQFLPGDFHHHLLRQSSPEWDSLTEVERLWAITLARGEHGALFLNAQHDQAGDGPVRDKAALARLVAAIRRVQAGLEPTGDVDPAALAMALGRARGRKPTIAFRQDGASPRTRYLIKLNARGPLNEARVTDGLARLAFQGGIQTAACEAVRLDPDEDVLVQHDYAYDERPARGGQRTLLRYNRVSFRVLLANDPALPAHGTPSVAHLVRVIDRFSADPDSDRLELLRRLLFDIGVRHTANGPEHLELVDRSCNEWRLAPSFHLMPNPAADAAFAIHFGDGLTAADFIGLTPERVEGLIEEVGVDRRAGLAAAARVVTALGDPEPCLAAAGVSAEQRALVTSLIDTTAVQNTRLYLADQPGAIAPVDATPAPGSTPRPG